MTAITFINESGRAVDVYWADYQGEEQFWFELQPGQSQRQETYVTHAWCMRDKTSQIALLAAVATQAEQVATMLGDLQWKGTTSIPDPSSAPFDSARGQQLVFYKQYVYVFGGRGVDDESLTTVYFSAIQPDGTLAEWNETTPLPGRYDDHVVVRVDDYVYLLTGAAGADDVYYARFDADGSLGAWKQTAPLSPSRQTFAAVSYGDFIYATGGNSGGIQDFVQYTSVSSDGGLNPWRRTRPLPQALQEHTMIAYDGYLYVIGGKNANYDWQTEIYFSAIQPDGTLAQWNATASLPEEHGSAAFEWNGDIYLLGSNSAYYTHILENHTLGEWQRTASLPAPVDGLRAGVHNGYAYALGGYDLTGHQSTAYQGFYGSVAEFRDCTSGWTRLEIGSYAKVSQENPSPNRIREAPDSGATIIHQIYPGGIVRVVEGPVCKNGLVFWKVENALIPGGAGWTAEGNGKEYYLEPVK
jgi:hypothetical protein